MMPVTLPYRSLRRVCAGAGERARRECAMPQVTQGTAGRLAWPVFGAPGVLVSASAWSGAAGGETWGATLGFIPTSITFAAVGALIAARTGNRLGWLFLAAGAGSASHVPATGS